MAAKRKRQEFAAKIQQGVLREKILDDIRDSVTENNFFRHHLLEKKDLLNIERAFGLKDFQRHINDQDSVLAWITEWEQSADTNPILFCKFQDEMVEGYDLSKEDFVLIIQSPFQRHMLQKFGTKGICCDSTHGTNAYDFLLTTCLVVDEYGEGFPAAWCLSNHEDFTTMCTFFREVKKNCAGSITSKWFMSDIAPQYYNAWVGVMNDIPRPQKLLCTWHVDRAINMELRKKIGDLSTEAEIYKMFRTVLEQTNESLFDDCLRALLHRLSLSSKTAAFHKYFVRDWVPRKHQWAYCFRTGLGINTNMFVEAFHRVFKYGYLKGKVNKRLDNCILNLLKYVRDKTFDRLIKVTKGKSTNRVNMIHDRHLRSLSLPVESVNCEEDDAWTVLGEDGRSSYKVCRIASACEETNCGLRCQECCVCVHLYVCNCPDNLITSTICKHIHLVNRYLNGSSVPKDNLSQFPRPENSSMDPDYQEASSDTAYYDSTNEMNFLRDCLNKGAVGEDGESTIERTKRSLKAKLLRMINDVEVCEDEDALQQLEKSVNSSYSLFTLIKQHKYTTSAISAAIPKGSAPANKKIEVQKRFYSTKRKTQKRNIRLAKPTKEEKMEMIENWRNNEKSEQNNNKVPVDFTSENHSAQGMLCFIV